MVRQWLCRDRRLTFEEPLIMGVMNITPDSFSDGGKFYRHSSVMLEQVLAQGAAMIADGARILDVGGESSRPGAEPVGHAEEIRRVVPVIEALSTLDCLVSVDTYHIETARAAVTAGADIINDISGGADPAMQALVAASGVGLCLMHMQGSPQTMQNNPSYADVVEEVAGFLAGRISTCVASGVMADQIAIDPGFGFGKALKHNLHLLRCLEQVRFEQHPLLVGLSRKSMLGTITGKPVEERDTASVVAAVLAAQNGADIIRVHDVAKTTDGLQVLKHVAAPS
jgi:dihydropteroate synthase